MTTLNEKKLQQTFPSIPPRQGGSPALRAAPLVGLEVEWRVRRRFSLVASTSFWEGESRAIESGEVLFQDKGLLPFSSNRIHRISFNEYNLKGRLHLLEEPERHRLFLEIGFFGQVKVTYREDYNYIFADGNEQFLRNVLSRAVSKGGYIFSFGMGGDYFLTRWLALSVSGNYRFGKATQLIYESSRHTFVEQDALTEAVGVSSFFPKVGEPVSYREGDTAIPLKIELQGFQANAGIRIFF